jgi:hypothetical protein
LLNADGAPFRPAGQAEARPAGAGLAHSDEAKSIAGVILEIDGALTLAGP